MGKVLVVDDEASLLNAVQRILRNAGFAAVGCSDGEAAVKRIGNESFDAIVSDISMPKLSGIELLRTVREKDLDLPVILVTGVPSLESATDAVELAAFKYLTKPLDYDMLVRTVTRAARLYQLARAKREALNVLGNWHGIAAERAAVNGALDRAIEGLRPAFQPIVRASDKSVYGYEALLRSTEQSLPTPGAILDAAERLDRLADVGGRMRERSCQALLSAPDDVMLFLNLHPLDLLDDTLLDPESACRAAATRLVLEVTERATLDGIPDLRERVRALRRAGYRVAIDDLGAGYAGLTSFVWLEPDFVKLDMSLVRDVDKSPVKQRLIRSMTELSRDMGLHVVAEGIETPEERDAVVELGTDLLQGYRFGKPEFEMQLPGW